MLENNFVIQEEVEKELGNRWNWLTEDIADKEDRLNTQLVLESSYKEMVKQGTLPRGWLEQQLNEEGVLTEAPQMSGAVGDYVIPKVMFPMIKRVMPDLIANKLVSVQPLSAPTGVIYYIVNQYSNTKGDIRKGDEFSANPMQTTPAYSTWYSSEKVGPFVKTVAKGDAATFSVADLADAYAFLQDGDQLKRFEVFDVLGGRGVNAEDAFKEYGDVVDTTKEIEIPTDNFTEDADGNVVVKLFVVYNQEGSSRIPEMEFGIEHQNISTTERKLKVRWTKEAEQDMMAYHKINVEQELVKVAAIQMNYEIDREVMNFIDDHIIPELRFNHNWINDEAGQNNTQGNYLDRHRCLAQHMYQVATKIAEFNHIAPADWMVCSPQVAAVLQMLPDWKKGEIADAKTTFYNAGFLSNGSMAVYVDPNRCGPQAYEITLGYKSKDSTYGAGVVYSPYANWMSSTIVNPDNFNNVRGTFTRYGLTLCPRGQYNYATISIDELAI